MIIQLYAMDYLCGSNYASVGRVVGLDLEITPPLSDGGSELVKPDFSRKASEQEALAVGIIR